MRFVAMGLFLTLSACVSTGESDPDKARRYMATGDEYYGNGEWKKALDWYDDAVKANPAEPFAYLRRGNTHMRLAKHKDATGTLREHVQMALANYGQCLRLNPLIADAYLNRAMIWAKRAMYKMAVDDLIKHSRLRPKDPRPHYDIARLYEDKFEDNSMLLRAMEHYEKFIEYGGREIVTGVEYQRVVDSVRAWKKIKAAMGKGPKNGKGTSRNKDEEKAIELYEKARSLAMKRERTKEEEKAAFSMLQELMEKYAATDIVKQKRMLIEVLLRRLAPKD